MAHEKATVLALYPNHPGYAYAFFAKPSKISAWAVRIFREPHKGRNASAMSDIDAVLDKFQPEAVVLEDCCAKKSRRRERIRRLHQSIAHAARSRMIEVVKYSRDAVRQTFESVGAMTRHEIAQAVTRELPELAAYLPKQRKAWESERSIMGLFAATALALTHYRTADALSGSVGD